MGLSRHANARDGNEKEIVKALLHIGASVVRLDKPCDLLVGYRGRCYLFEVKLPLGPRGGSSHSQLNELQKDFAQTWRGQFDIIRSAEDAIEILTAVAVSSPTSHRVH